ncbi:uncharacterized protein G2W53_009471 [Senna tora]|uniref:Uncharacterized protein n=1 Tax=Senna tora TaxID=362788 RepID=A0A834WYL8_9FABA|nr:uncharacterized protein G2W53_009471 [Senna tora]
MMIRAQLLTPKQDNNKMICHTKTIRAKLLTQSHQKSKTPNTNRNINSSLLEIEGQSCLNVVNEEVRRESD